MLLRRLGLVARLEVFNGRFEAFEDFVGKRFLGRDFLDEIGFTGGEELLHLGLAVADAIDRDIIEVVILHRPEVHDHETEGLGLILVLLEEFDGALTTFDGRFGLRIKIGAELGECLHFTELGEVELRGAGDLS